MQTFLPYPDFVRTARILDYKRLGKQRSEVKIIWKTLQGHYEGTKKESWARHPAVRMWAGCELALLFYGLEITSEWVRRGYRDNMTPWFVEHIAWSEPIIYPDWFGYESFHRSHRSKLLSKWPEHYREFWRGEPDDLPYYWPTHHVGEAK